MARKMRSVGELKLMGYRLATAEILYWMPDHPTLVQSFIWQHYDLVPEYPELHKFLNFWKDNIDGTLHSVRVAASQSIEAPRMGSATALYQYH